MSYYAAILIGVHYEVILRIVCTEVLRVSDRQIYRPLILVLVLVLLLCCVGAGVLSHSITVLSENAHFEKTRCIVIDAGHGGIDGGATSCTGRLESNMNLEISCKLNDMLRLLGIQTLMIRTTDISVYTSGKTIAAQKVSDLKERVRIVNSIDNALLISIHMNYYTDSRYYGPQIFYAPTVQSQEIGRHLQEALKTELVPESNRVSKPAEGIYLMQHIQCPGVLIECGFISNPEENARLNSTAYQQKLCAVIATNLCRFSLDA